MADRPQIEDAMSEDIEKLLDELLSPTAHKVFRDGFRERITRFVDARIASLESRERKLREALKKIAYHGNGLNMREIARSALANEATATPPPDIIWRHKKRGTTYIVVGQAEI